MFGRRQTSVPEPEPAIEPEGAGKNRPTPKRKDVQAARRQPLVPDARGAGRPAGKASRADKQAAREQRTADRARMMAGEERYLMARDRGPERRFARDWVDARLNLGELLLPVMVLLLVFSFFGAGLQTRYPGVYTTVVVVTYTLVLMSFVDALFMSWRMRRALVVALGPKASPKGLTLYAVVRAFQLRRTRTPRPQVRRGEFPG